MYKLTVLLVPRAMNALQDTADITGLTMGDTVNRALQMMAFLEMERATGGYLWVARLTERPWWAIWRPRYKVVQLEWGPLVHEEDEQA